MKRSMFVIACVLMIATGMGCSGQQHDAVALEPMDSNAVDSKPMDSNSVDSSKAPPVIDHLDTYPFPVPSAWKQEKFEVRKYDEGMDWEAVFTIDGDVTEEALAYKEVIEALGYETQTLLNEVFKIGTAEFAGVIYHGTFTFDLGDAYSEWGEGQGYVEISFTEKQ